MTTATTATTATKETKLTKSGQPDKRVGGRKGKPLIKRDFNDFGRFCAKLRIDLNMSSPEWSKALNVSSSTLSDIERGDGKITFGLAKALYALVEAKAPEYLNPLSYVIANELGILLIPANTPVEVLEHAYDVLNNGFTKEMVAGQTGQSVE